MFSQLTKALAENQVKAGFLWRRNLTYIFHYVLFPPFGVKPDMSFFLFHILFYPKILIDFLNNNSLKLKSCLCMHIYDTYMCCMHICINAHTHINTHTLTFKLGYLFVGIKIPTFQINNFLVPEKKHKTQFFFLSDKPVSSFQVLNNKYHQYYLAYIPHPASW